MIRLALAFVLLVALGVLLDQAAGVPVGWQP